METTLQQYSTTPNLQLRHSNPKLAVEGFAVLLVSQLKHEAPVPFAPLGGGESDDRNGDGGHDDGDGNVGGGEHPLDAREQEPRVPSLCARQTLTPKACALSIWAGMGERAGN